MDFTHFKTAAQFGRAGASARLAQRLALYRRLAARALAELARERGVEIADAETKGFTTLIFDPKNVEKFSKRYQQSPYERRVDFAAIKKVLDDDQVGVDLAMRVPIRKVLDDLINLIKEQDKRGGITDSFVMGLALTTGPEAQRILGDYLLKVWKRGREIAINELPEKLHGKIKKFAGLEPVQAINFFQNLRPWLVKGIIDDELKKVARLELTEHLKGGRTLTETIGNLRSAWEPWIGDPTKVLPSGITGTSEDILQAYRLENIVRTEAIGALNSGRTTIADEAGDFVLGFSISAILDDRTTLICQEADGVIIRKDDPRIQRLTPPLHFQCRSILVFITSDDVPIKWNSEAELDKIVRLIQPGFK